LNLGPIIGGVIGGFAAIMAGAFFIQRRRSRQQLEDGLKQAWAERLFGKERDLALEMQMVNTGDAEGTGGMAELAPVNPTEQTSDLRIPLRTRFSFHGDPMGDELDVPAGAALTGISRNRAWWVAIDENTQTVGLIPATYCSEV